MVATRAVAAPCDDVVVRSPPARTYRVCASTVLGPNRRVLGPTPDYRYMGSGKPYLGMRPAVLPRLTGLLPAVVLNTLHRIALSPRLGSFFQGMTFGTGISLNLPFALVSGIGAWGQQAPLFRAECLVAAQNPHAPAADFQFCNLRRKCRLARSGLLAGIHPPHPKDAQATPGRAAKGHSYGGWGYRRREVISSKRRASGTVPPTWSFVGGPTDTPAARRLPGGAPPPLAPPAD